MTIHNSPRGTKIAVPNGELYFESIGEGDPLILIHSGFSDRRNWNHQIQNLKEKFNTIIYDQRGSGHSSVIASAFSPADDLKALMDYLKIPKASIVGHSIGGTIALDFALQYPDRVTTLALLAPGLNGYSWSKEYIDLMQSVWGVLDPKEMTNRFLSSPFYSIAMRDSNISSEITTITQQSFEKVLTWKTFNPQDVQWFFSQPISHLKNLRVPTLVTYGDQDSHDIKQIAQILRESLPNVEEAQIRNSDHLLNFEEPRKLNSLIIDFISRCQEK